MKIDDFRMQVPWDLLPPCKSVGTALVTFLACFRPRGRPAAAPGDRSRASRIPLAPRGAVVARSPWIARMSHNPWILEWIFHQNPWIGTHSGATRWPSDGCSARSETGPRGGGIGPRGRRRCLRGRKHVRNATSAVPTDLQGGRRSQATSSQKSSIFMKKDHFS